MSWDEKKCTKCGKRIGYYAPMLVSKGGGYEHTDCVEASFKYRMRLWLHTLICRTIGCTSPFARHYEWPHREVCTRLIRLDKRS